MSNVHDFPSYPIDLPCDVEYAAIEPLAYGHPLHPANRGGYQAIEPEPYRFRLTPFWKAFGICAILAIAIGAIWAAVR